MDRLCRSSRASASLVERYQVLEAEVAGSALWRCITSVMGFEAIANPAESNGNQQISQEGAAKASVAVCPPVSADADLLLIVNAWPELPQDVQKMIVGVVRATVKQ